MVVFSRYQSNGDHHGEGPVERVDLTLIMNHAQKCGSDGSAVLPRTFALTHEEQKLAKERIERDEEDLVRLYLTDIGQYPLLTKDDEVRLAKAIEAGNDRVSGAGKGRQGDHRCEEARASATGP